MSLRRLPPARSSFRALAALVAALGLVLTASACEAKPGAAAFVGDQKITEAEVAGYVGTAPSSAPQQAGSLTPRQQVVSTLVQVQLYRSYLQQRGGVPSDAALLASREAAFTLVTGQGPPDSTQFRTSLESLGFAGDFADAYSRQIELEYQVIQLSGAKSLAELASAVAKVTPKPRISPRYGTWEAAQLSLNGAGTTPGYLQLQSGSGV